MIVPSRLAGRDSSEKGARSSVIVRRRAPAQPVEAQRRSRRSRRVSPGFMRQDVLVSKDRADDAEHRQAQPRHAPARCRTSSAAGRRAAAASSEAGTCRCRISAPDRSLRRASARRPARRQARQTPRRRRRTAASPSLASSAPPKAAISRCASGAAGRRASRPAAARTAPDQQRHHQRAEGQVEERCADGDLVAVERLDDERIERADRARSRWPSSGTDC